jgi:hypothetical protein
MTSEKATASVALRQSFWMNPVERSTVSAESVSRTACSARSASGSRSQIGAPAWGRCSHRELANPRVALMAPGRARSGS